MNNGTNNARVSGTDGLRLHVASGNGEDLTPDGGAAMMDLGFNYVGKVDHSSSKQFFTVDDGVDVWVYEGPRSASLRDAIHLAFVEPWDYDDERQVAGQYPNYRIEEVQ